MRTSGGSPTTGSTGVQIGPAIADEVESLVMYQRSATWATPLNNHPISAAQQAYLKANYAPIKAELDASVGGFLHKLAAWPYFLEKNYGRAILTTSIGMFGLMDNLGYAIAKASMIGMAKSLTVGRKDANINVNCIAPNAMTRISGHTAEEQESAARAAESLPAMDPANVAPMVAYLAHESCTVSGETYLAGGGRYARLFVAVNDGYLHPGLTGATVDDVAANWVVINDEASYYVPSDLNDCVGHYMSHPRA